MMKQVITVILAIGILIMPSGCSCNKNMTMSMASKLKQNNFIVLHTPEHVYDEYNYEFKKDELSWQLKNNSYHKGRTIHVYTIKELSIDPLSDLNDKVYIEKSGIDLISCINTT